MSSDLMSVKRAIENLVRDHHIEKQLKEIIVPTEDVIEIKNGKKKINERSLYPGYAFAHLDLDTALWVALAAEELGGLDVVAGFGGAQYVFVEGVVVQCFCRVFAAAGGRQAEAAGNVGR